MQELNLKHNEEIIYTANMLFTNEEVFQKEYTVYLTNLNLILYKNVKKLFREPKKELLKLPLANFNFVDGEPFFDIFKNDDYDLCGIKTIYQRKIIELAFEDDEEKDYITESKIFGKLLAQEIKKNVNKAKVCPNCNAVIENGMLFCQSCGTKI